MTTFLELGLSDPFLRAVEASGYQTATPIQAKAIPAILAGSDLVGLAQTGTGKTGAFTLPMLDRLMQSNPASQETPPEPRRRRGKSWSQARPIRALVLAPTRELAAQVGESLNTYGQFTKLNQTVIFGGVSQQRQVNALRRGVDSLVATPGRLLDLMGQGFVDLADVEILVFDEADQMLDMGFLPALRRIVAAVPSERQTLMFSATMPAEIRKLAQQWLRNPVSVEAAPVATPADRITQSVYHVEKHHKPDLLAAFLKEQPRGRTLVFSRTKHGADKIVKRLIQSGVRAAAIHGNKSQNARTRVLTEFKRANPPVLVATDIAARGLDIDEIAHVVNFDLPETPETYVHRIGRTARAGASGIAVSFCAGDERSMLRQIERLTRLTIEVVPTPAGFTPSSRPVPSSEAQPSRSHRPGGGVKRRTNGRKSGGRPPHGEGSGGAGKQKAFRRTDEGQASPGRPSKSRQSAGGTTAARTPRKRRSRRFGV